MSIHAKNDGARARAEERRRGRIAAASGLAAALAVALVAIAVVPPVAAQFGGDRDGLDLGQLGRRVFPPRLVVALQREIGLTEGQRQALIAEMQSTQSDLVPMQIELGEAGRDLARALDEPVVEEARVLALAERVLALEGRVKRRHLALLVRVKNLLTVEQQRELQRLRHERGGGHGTDRERRP